MMKSYGIISYAQASLPEPVFATESGESMEGLFHNTLTDEAFKLGSSLVSIQFQRRMWLRRRENLQFKQHLLVKPILSLRKVPQQREV